MRRQTLLIALVTLAVVAAVELSADFYQRAKVPRPSDWRELADHVRSRWQEQDVVIASDAWTDPLVREYLGDQIPLQMAGRSDLYGYARAWSISLHAPPERRAREPIGERVLETHAFGPLSLQLTELSQHEVLALDLVEAFERAQVYAAEKPCTPQGSRPSGGGLGRGPMRPAEYWICPGSREWIGRTTIEDLDYQPRRCIWQQANVRAPTRVTFPSVGPAKRLAVHGGHYLRDERKLESPPVTLNVYVDDSLAGQMTHRDGEGWKAFEVALDPKQPVSLSFETVATGRDQNFCWSAKTLEN